VTILLEIKEHDTTIEMALSAPEYLSPVMEGFSNPTMATVFREMLMITPVEKSKGRGPKTPIGTSSDGTCPPPRSEPQTATSGSGSGSTRSEKIAFLKSILKEQRDTADSLMESAKTMAPVAQKIMAQKGAYEAAFESDILAPMPNTSGTLQGFTLVFFTLAFFSLGIVVSIMTNQATGKVDAALKMFGGFIIAYIVSISLISKYG
jgi:hypothetical protein